MNSKTVIAVAVTSAIAALSITWFLSYALEDTGNQGGYRNPQLETK